MPIQSDTRPKAYSISGLLKEVPIGRSKLYDEISKGRLRVRKVGSRTLVLAEELERWLASMPEGLGSKEA